jgi:hypothetical protein
MAIGFNLYRAIEKGKKAHEIVCPDLAEFEQLQYEKKQWKERERKLLSENGALLTENNELKMLNRKPLIIYKNVEETPINDDASKDYIGILSERYK